MKVHSNFSGQTSNIVFLRSHAQLTLTSFCLYHAKPALAEEATADSTATLDTRATTAANVESTADLVETKVVLRLPRQRQKRLLTLPKSSK
ncbi:MAG: hypothetical protein ACLRSA_02015 [Streptococcus salivarius]